MSLEDEEDDSTDEDEKKGVEEEKDVKEGSVERERNDGRSETYEGGVLRHVKLQGNPIFIHVDASTFPEFELPSDPWTQLKHRHVAKMGWTLVSSVCNPSPLLAFSFLHRSLVFIA